MIMEDRNRTPNQGASPSPGGTPNQGTPGSSGSPNQGGRSGQNTTPKHGDGQNENEDGRSQRQGGSREGFDGDDDGEVETNLDRAGGRLIDTP
jgi:hypothetical protein